MAFRRYDKPRRTTRDFHRPRAGNPMFPHGRRQSGGPGFGPRFFLFLGLLLVGGTAWYLLWSSAFRASKITVTGVNAPTEAAVRAGLKTHLDGHVLGVVPRANLLVFNDKRALADIGRKVQLGSITLRKKLPDEIIVEATEKVGRAALDWHDRLYTLDADGVVIREMSAEEITALGELPPRMDSVDTAGLGAQSVDAGAKPAGKAPAKDKSLSAGAAAVANALRPAEAQVPLIMVEDLASTAAAAPKDSADDATADDGGDAATADEKDAAQKAAAAAKDAEKEAVPGATMVPGTAMRLILQAYSRLPDIAGARVKRFLVRASSETVEGVMDGDWRVLMSSALPFDVQGERLGIVLREKIGAQKANLEYVDLRYNERIFFRMKGAATPPPAPAPTPAATPAATPKPAADGAPKPGADASGVAGAKPAA